MAHTMKTDIRNDGGHWGGMFRVAIIGAATLKGRELKEVLSDRNFPSTDIRLLDDEESLGQVQAVGEEPTFIQSVLPEHLENVDFTFFASDENYTRDTWKLASDAGSDIIDLSYALEGQPGVLLRAQKVGKLTRSIVTILEPASEHGRSGMDELHEQTVNLLSFQQLPKGVFDAQVAFNVVDRYGEKAKPALSAVEDRIQRHFRSMVQDKLSVPSLMLLQAPIFHGHAFSLYIEFGGAAQTEELVAAVSGEHVDVLQGADESPSNVNAAGQEQIQVFVRNDPQTANAFWLWAATDNLRIAALAAAECAETMIASRPRGTVQ